MNDSKMNIEITEITPLLYEFAAKAEREALNHEAWTEKGIAETVESGGTYLVALNNGEYLGHIGMMAALDERYITNIVVLPSARGLGIGSALLKELINRQKANKAAFLSLEVRASNLAAKKLYEKYGFSLRGVRKNFYRAPDEDAEIMTLDFEYKE